MSEAEVDHETPAGLDVIDDEPYSAVNERKVLIQQYDYAVRQLVDMVVEGELTLNPDYQRLYRWEEDKASRFVESILMNIPVPVVYFAEEADGTFSVIDGQQRLTSLLNFIRPEAGQELMLNGLKLRPDLNGKKFTELNRIDRSAITKRPIRCIVVLNESDQALKFEVFERLNTGSSSLTEQEVRNSIFHGNFNDLIKVLARNADFLEMVALPENHQKNMKAEELILRFFAYRDLHEGADYPGNYTEYLNNYMEQNRSLTESRRHQLQELFETTIALIKEHLGPGTAFRRPVVRGKDDRFAHTLINGAIYESQMIGVSRLVEAGEIGRMNRGKVMDAFSDDKYWSTLFQGTAKKATAIRRTEELCKYLFA
ncbi:DUF262 domain-containing protein [Pseudomonas palleroniana]|uniref:DUF262 domain-containing protein n=1 Tax=Pseudomonas palleroniana TaxID=191390 RepID=A0A1H5LMU8_9PSED|nr:DUF262 domain-containing protein [Pseudomonas palleroniana]KAB0566607.1 DUF262 domain-containing protein [Pseudomonas palleroniana]PTC25593.1 DUF262 domain-containing protein [Pseudomonas palleroniana]SEE78320.1 Protein of unknown function DUF262 [Pseudomonas palleroniana]